MTNAAGTPKEPRRPTAMSGPPVARVKAGTAGFAALIGKALIAITVFFTITSGYAQLRAGRGDDLASRPLPDSVESDCALWFIGSSSMRRWSTLERDMHPWTAHNRSIGGATLTELSGRFAVERSPKPPRAVVFYAGENDLAFGVPDAVVTEEFRTFLRRKTVTLGDVPVFFISVKPSPTRWTLRPGQALFNRAVRRIAAERGDLFYIDIVPELFRGGRLGPFYDPDGMHLNDAGYEIWTRAVRGALRAHLPAELVRTCERAS